ncbi:MAG: MDR family oxidoreductase [Pseudomonadota bacterium]
MFKAIFLEKGEQPQLLELNESDLPEGDVLIDVDYSTLNYKDALAITGKAPIIRKYPIIPGIDLTGTVVESQHDSWQTGDKIILNGWGVGESYWGGMSQKARLNGNWLIRRPDNLSAQQAMAIGTAGYTAMLCVMALENHGITPESGEILVTGANGGVGSISIALLAKQGYTIIASTGRPEEADYLKDLGATDTINRSDLSEPGKPLAKERWAAAIDCVGSHTLANVCASTKYGGIIAACGLAQGMDFPATVAPFILRGITLQGVESVYVALEKRQQAWNRLANDLDSQVYENVAKLITLSETIDKAQEMIEGKIRGRVIIDVNN